MWQHRTNWPAGRREPPESGPSAATAMTPDSATGYGALGTIEAKRQPPGRPGGVHMVATPAAGDTPTIVVGIDGAWHRTGAVDWALDQAHRSCAGLRLVHVVDERFARMAAISSQTVGPPARELVGAVSNELRVSGTGSAVTADALAGTPGVVLAEAARSAQLLVVGRRGVGAFGRLLIGSTSENVVNHSDVPVVVVPDGWRPAAH